MAVDWVSKRAVQLTNPQRERRSQSPGPPGLGSPRRHASIHFRVGPEQPGPVRPGETEERVLQVAAAGLVTLSKHQLFGACRPGTTAGDAKWSSCQCLKSLAPSTCSPQGRDRQ